MTRYRYEKVGNCPNCGFPIMMKNRFAPWRFAARAKRVDEDNPPEPTPDDVIALCPCIEKIHTLAEHGKFRPFFYLEES